MSAKLFNPIHEGYDPKNRPVFICKDGNGFHVYKPGTGYKSRSFKKEDDADLLNIFDYQKGCSQNSSFYRPGDDKKLPQVKKAKAAAAPAPPPIQPKVPKPATTLENSEPQKNSDEIFTV